MTSKLKETQESRASYQAQFEEQIKECNTHKAALKEAEQKLESYHIHWQEEKSSLLQETVALRKTLKVMTSKLDETQESRASYPAKFEEQIKECNTHKTALKEACGQGKEETQTEILSDRIHRHWLWKAGAMTWNAWRGI